MTREWRRGAYLITTHKARSDLEAIYGFLKTSYWASGIPAETVRRSVENSLTFGLFTEGEQVGFARVVTDYATFAYLADVFVLEPHRRRGLGRWMMEVVFSHPELQGLRRWMLATRDAHGLYRKYGFADTPLTDSGAPRSAIVVTGASTGIADTLPERMMALYRLLPDRLLDRVILRVFGLPRAFGDRAELPPQPLQSLEGNEAG